MSNKTRLDVLLTEQGLQESRQKAQATIMSGLVFVNGQRVAQVKAFADARAVHVDEPAAVCGVLRQNRRNLFAHPLRRNGGAERICCCVLTRG